MQNIFVTYRQDMDAVVAHAIVYYYMDYYKREIKTVRVADRDVFPWETASAAARLFLVGYTPDYETFARLMMVAGDLIWIDNNMDKVAPIEARSTPECNFRKIKGKRSGDLSLCELMWDSYFAWVKKRPEIVNLVGRYSMEDLNHPEWDSRVVPFNLGLKLEKTDPLDPYVFEELWKKILCLKRDLDYETSIINTIMAKGGKKYCDA